ncbi:tyrosine-type recombinase/integrase [Bordetella sp. N]|uniref:tyrosine-type recombinase/integrase n=1 Tax=Bordetella sp. N TaxID=1746199 RepID=UPI000ACC50AF|nr:tyrosine-type recombinase/integrase [Bordetella sp. N]
MFGVDLIVKVDDATWVLHNRQLREGEVFLNWNSMPYAGTERSDGLIDEAKAFILQIIKRLEERIPSIAALPIKLRFMRLRKIVRWMVDHHLHSFSQLTPTHIEKLLQSVATKDGTALSQATVNSWRRLLEEAWLTRTKSWPGLSFNPATHVTLRHWSRAGRKQLRWQPLDQRLAIELLKDAMKWTEVAPPILGPIIRRIWQTRTESSKLSKAQFSILNAPLMQDLAHTPEFSSLRELMNEKDATPTFLVQEALRLTQAATLIQILFLCGTRISEAASLPLGSLMTTTHSDGFEYTYITGKLAKSSGRPHRWIAPPTVREAIDSLENLYSFVSPEHRTGLFLRLSLNGTIPRQVENIHQMTATAAARLAKEFARSPTREKPIPLSVRFHSHQGRKTFARFVATRDRNALGALSAQYGHIHSGITDRSYVGYDIELAELLSLAEQEDLTIRLTELLSAKTIGGKAGSRILDLMKHVDQAPKFRGKRALHNLAEKLISSGTKLVPCNWGYCLYVEHLSACKGTKHGPDEVRRAPDVCAKCSNFSVTERQAEWWSERYAKDEEILKRADLPEQTRAVIEQRLNTTASVIHQLGRRKEREIM